MGSLGPWEFLIIAGVIVLLFGAKKMPEMARSLGRSARILKAETKGMRDNEEHPPAQAEPTKPAQQQQQLPQANGQPQVPQVAPPIEQTQANKNIT